MQGLIKALLWQTVEMKARHQLSNCAAGTQHMVPVQLLSSKRRLKIPNACPGPKPGGGFSRDLGLRNILGGRWGIQDPRAHYRSSKLGNSHLGEFLKLCKSQEGGVFCLFCSLVWLGMTFSRWLVGFTEWKTPLHYNLFQSYKPWCEKILHSCWG